MSRQPWQVGLFDCCSDCNVFCKTCWCPCLSYAEIADAVAGGGPTAPCLIYMCLSPCMLQACCLGPKNRGHFRDKYGLNDAPCGGAAASFQARLLPRRPVCPQAVSATLRTAGSGARVSNY